jgi:hypothetical protein
VHGSSCAQSPVSAECHRCTAQRSARPARALLTRKKPRGRPSARSGAM